MGRPNAVIAVTGRTGLRNQNGEASDQFKRGERDAGATSVQGLGQVIWIATCGSFGFAMVMSGSNRVKNRA
jgi:hypothetical protein